MGSFEVFFLKRKFIFLLVSGSDWKCGNWGGGGLGSREEWSL